MTKFRRLGPCLLLGLMMVMAAVAFAQNPKTATDKRLESCCCKDSCPMMKTDATKSTASADKHGRCCGDSCDMKAGASQTGSASDKHGRCCGDSCDMKDGAMKNMAKNGAATDKHDCCCCGGDSCNMKQKNQGQ